MRRPLHSLPSPAATRAIAAVLAVVVVVGPAIPASPAAGQQEPPPQTAVDVAEPRLSPELQRVPIDSSQFGVARGRYAAAQHNLRVAEEAQRRAVAVVESLTATEARLALQLELAQARQLAADQRATELRASMEALAVEAYVGGGGSESSPVEHLDLEAESENRRDEALVREVTNHHRDEYLRNLDIRDRSEREAERVSLLLVSVRQRREESLQARASAEATAFALLVDVEEARQAVADSRLTAQVVGADFPLVAMDAFWRAAAKVNALAPACHVRWTIIAGISRVEGVHGTWGGSSLDGDGNTTERIRGPALDGNKFARVPDSDGGLWDDDTVWDRGVGPMGFIPSSWKIFGADGNGDGNFDPHNIYDAAEASAKLLCWASGGLDTTEGLEAALFQYNRSERYVRIVSGYIASYDALGLPPA